MAGEGGEKKKRFRRWKPWRAKSRTSEGISITPPKSLWEKITTSKDSTRKSKIYNKPTMESNRGCAKSEQHSGEKEFSIVGPMEEGNGR